MFQKSKFWSWPVSIKNRVLYTKDVNFTYTGHPDHQLCPSPKKLSKFCGLNYVNPFIKNHHKKSTPNEEGLWNVCLVTLMGPVCFIWLCNGLLIVIHLQGIPTKIGLELFENEKNPIFSINFRVRQLKLKIAKVNLK